MQLANTLLNVDEAIERILSQIEQLPAESVDLTEALGRVLAEDIVSDIMLPPFANSSMDGYALCADDTTGADKDSPATLRVIMDIPAGIVPPLALAAGQAARIMTGAPLPDGANAIVPVEETDGQWTDDNALPEQVSVFRSLKPGNYVRPAGEDVNVGDLILERMTELQAAEIGALAALGRAQVPVIRRPKVAILPSGDEIIPVSEPLAPGKIRDVNSYTLQSLLRKYGAEPIVMPVARDTMDDIRSQFNSALELSPDMLISSAGASVGAADFAYAVLQELGHVDFWKINLRPGKPLAFGELQGIPFFGLPGNPVSVMVTFDVIVRPTLLKMTGHADDWVEVHAKLAENLRSDGRRSFVRVTLIKDRDGGWLASATGTQSSGALMSMVRADGLLIVPEGVTHVNSGEVMRVRVLRPQLLYS